MMQVSNGSISEETLQIALQYGIVDMEEISKNVELKKRNEILSQHPYKVWQNNQGIWLTYLPDEGKDGYSVNERQGKLLKMLLLIFIRNGKNQFTSKMFFKSGWTRN